MTAPPDGRILGAYRLLEQVGRGGMGLVYRAEHLRLRREAAVKVLPVDLARESEFLKRFEREAASAAALQHPNILAVWDYGEQDDTPYLVMPYIAGGTLKDRLRRGSLPAEEIIGYLRQMADALDYAHERGIIHRDVKPANMLLDQRGQLYLADFGIARALEGSEGLTRAGAGIGTPEYMAPEQAQGRADARSDLYALGIILYQMLAGRVPFTGASGIEVLMKHLREPPPPLDPRDGAPVPPPQVDGVLQRALAKDPDERYQSGQALFAALCEGLVGSAGGFVTPAWQLQLPPHTPAPGGLTPLPTWPQRGGRTPTPYPQAPAPAAPAPPAHIPAPAPATVVPRKPRPLLVAGIAGLIALLLLASAGGGLAVKSRADGNATATAGARAAAPPTAGPASPVAAPTGGGGTAAAAAAPAAAYPSGGKYSTLEPVGRRGGRVTEGFVSDATTLNPLLAGDAASDARVAMLFNALVNSDPDTGLPYPDLATELPSLGNGGISADGLTYTFNLRRDVRWHDGQRFTARDVVFTYQAMADQDLGSPRAAEIAERIASVTAPGDYTVVFQLKRVVASFLTRNTYYIVPEHILKGVPPDQVKSHPFSTGDPRATIGTGPFMFQEWVRDDHATFVKNPNYFREEPALDQYAFRHARDTQALAAQVQSGELDFAPIGADSVGALSGDQNLKVLAYDTYGFTYFAYQLDPGKSTLFQDKVVRQALAYAVDRDTMVRTLQNNLATVAQGTMPVPSWAYAPDQLATRYTYDPQKAEALLDQAGWTRGPDGIRGKDGRKLQFTIWTRAGGGEAIARFLQQQWQRIGVAATPGAEDARANLARLTETHDFELAVASFTWTGDPDQTAMWASQSYQGGFNVNKYANRQVDALLARGLAELDQGKRKQLYVELQNVLLDDLPSMVLFFNQTAGAVNRRVHNLKPNGVSLRWNAQTWWVDAETVASPAPTAAATPTSAYAADFRKWPLGEAPGQARQQLDPATGEYRVALLRDRLAPSIYTPENQPAADFVLEVDARRVAGPDTAGYGLVFRVQPQGPADKAPARYVFAVTADGRFSFILVNPDATEQVIQRPAPAAAIKPGAATNHLTVTGKGGQVTLAINGQTVGAYTVAITAAGRFGVYAVAPPGAEGVEVAFSNLRLSPAP